MTHDVTVLFVRVSPHRRLVRKGRWDGVTRRVVWRVALSPPELGDDERSRLIAAFDEGGVSSIGRDIECFEAELAQYLSADAVVLVVSGTAALHLALLCAGVGPGDTVLVNTVTFAASAFAIAYTGATPHFVDCDPVTWQLDLELLREHLSASEKTGALPKALIHVDLYGSTGSIDEVESLCADYGVVLIEDAAEAIGSSCGARKAGTFGDFGVLSFNGNKVLAAGSGGAVIAKDPSALAKIRHLSAQARSPAVAYHHDAIGYNYRPNNLSAAVGRGQLTNLDFRLDKRAYVRFLYREMLEDVVDFQLDPAGTTSNNWLTTVSLKDGFAAPVVAALRSKGIEARPAFRPMHLQRAFRGAPRIAGHAAEQHFARALSLPSSGFLDVATVEEIANTVRVAAKENRAVTDTDARAAG